LQGLKNAIEVLAMPVVPASPVKSVGPQARPPIESAAIPTAGAPAPSYEVGVALFSRFARASRLEAELTTLGYRVSVWALELAVGRRYEVRTGPYGTRAAADADAIRIRALGGYADARVIPSSNAPQ
jgi:cell division septation protein DedD